MNITTYCSHSWFRTYVYTYCGIADFPSANKDVYTHLGVSFFLRLL